MSRPPLAPLAFSAGSLALVACGGSHHPVGPLAGDAPPRLYLASYGQRSGDVAGGRYVGYGPGPAEALTVVDQDGLVALARPSGGGTEGECESGALDDEYQVTRAIRTDPVEIVLQCRPGVDDATCDGARQQFWSSLTVECPDDTCDALGNPSCSYTATGCVGPQYDAWRQRRVGDRVAAAESLDLGFQQTVVAQGLRLSDRSRVVDAAAVAWATAPAGRQPYLALDTDGDGVADIVTDTVVDAATGERSYDTWLRAARCTDLAHDGWCRVAHDTVVLCADGAAP